MKIIYRISDGSHKKDKLPQATKRHCLDNALRVFAGARFHFLADNCAAETLAWLDGLGQRVERTSLGNSGSFRRALELGAAEPDPAQVVYLLEDDYLHLPGAPQALAEGLEIADYVSLYDHPDKYAYDVRRERKPNRAVRDGGEATRVLLTASTHWKLTNSTTMTFAAKASTLKEDLPVWQRYTRTHVPKDYKAFRYLIARRHWASAFTRSRRRLVTPIPGLATHTELRFISPRVDWSAV
jgi:hypothetical protein